MVDGAIRPNVPYSNAHNELDSRAASPYTSHYNLRGRGVAVTLQLPKLSSRVRVPSPALTENAIKRPLNRVASSFYVFYRATNCLALCPASSAVCSSAACVYPRLTAQALMPRATRRILPAVQPTWSACPAPCFHCSRLPQSEPAQAGAHHRQLIAARRARSPACASAAI